MCVSVCTSTRACVGVMGEGGWGLLQWLWGKRVDTVVVYVCCVCCVPPHQFPYMIYVVSKLCILIAVPVRASVRACVRACVELFQPPHSENEGRTFFLHLHSFFIS